MMTSVVRICQGLLDKGSSPTAAEHFEIFQAAVNYYLLALAGLESRQKGPVADLRKQIPDRWEKWTDRTGVRRQGLRESLDPWLQSLAGHPVRDLEEAWSLLQTEPQVEPKARVAALDPLLSKCGGGEGAIQQQGRSYWPRF